MNYENPKKKVILIFIDWFTPGYKAGGPVRSCRNMTDRLSDEFQFKIICRDTDYQETAPYLSVKSNEWNKINDVYVYYLSKKRITIANIKKLIKETDFDIAYINGIYSFFFSILPFLFLKQTNKKIIISVRGMLSEHSLNVKALKKKLFIKVAKAINLYKGAYFHATCEQEKEDIKHFFPKIKTEIISNFSVEINTKSHKNIFKKKGELRIYSLARIAEEKNTLKAIEYLKDLKGEIKYDLYGSIYNNDYWEKCKTAIKNLPQNIRVEYKGCIDLEKSKKIAADYHFLFLPTKGENFGHSILECLLSKRPVIISDKTPWRNLYDANAGYDLPLEEKKMTKIIQKCIDTDNEEFEKMCIAAFEFAKQKSTDKNTKNKMLQLFAGT